MNGGHRCQPLSGNQDMVREKRTFSFFLFCPSRFFYRSDDDDDDDKSSRSSSKKNQETHIHNRRGYIYTYIKKERKGNRDRKEKEKTVTTWVLGLADDFFMTAA